MAQKASRGKVFTVDIKPGMLDIMRQRIKREGIENVTLIQGNETSPELEPNSVDLITMIDVYHELGYPREMMQNTVGALRPGGRFVLLEYRMEDPSGLTSKYRYSQSAAIFGASKAAKPEFSRS